MSATTELLLEQIRQQEDAIRAAAESGHDTKSMREELLKLRQRLAQANQALNEGKTLLKG
jgi:Mg2+ and Co2+ transporter CorA